MVPTRSSPAKGAGAAAGAAGLAGGEGARTGCALRVCVGRGAGFFFATVFLTGGVFLRAIGLLAGVFCRLDLAFFLVVIWVPRSDLPALEPRSAIDYSWSQSINNKQSGTLRQPRTCLRDRLVIGKRTASGLGCGERCGTKRLPRSLDERRLERLVHWLALTTHLLRQRLGCPIEPRGVLPLAEEGRKPNRGFQQCDANPLRADLLGDRKSLAQHPAGAIPKSETDRCACEVYKIDGDASAISQLAAKRQGFFVQRLRLIQFPLCAVQLRKAGERFGELARFC